MTDPTDTFEDKLAALKMNTGSFIVSIRAIVPESSELDSAVASVFDALSWSIKGLERENNDKSKTRLG